MSGAEVGASYDMHSPDYADRWMEINRQLRETCPVAKSDHHGTFWVLSRHDVVTEVARDDVRFSSRNDLGEGDGYQGISIPPAPGRSTPIESDPPEFIGFRQLLNPHFAPAALKRWQPAMQAITDACLDRVVETGKIDFVLDLANPMPGIFVVELLGLPVNEWKRYAQPFHDIVASMGDPERYAAISMQLLDIVVELSEIVPRRRSKPGEDLISTLAQAEIDGQVLPIERVVEMSFLTIAGGVDTTTALLANAVRWLGQHPDQRERLTNDAGLVPIATEEFLRYFSPVQGNARTVTTETAVGDEKLCPMDRVWISWAAANHDPAVFDHPDELLIDRFPNRHTAFGIGIHRCLGSNFARSMFATMLRAVLDRCPYYVVDEGASQRYESIGQVNGWATMPARFTPSRCLGGDTSYATILEEHA